MLLPLAALTGCAADATVSAPEEAASTSEALSTYGTPMPADYDGDGKMDLAVKMDNGRVRIDNSSNGYGYWDFDRPNYGGSSCHPAPADFDGDGRADIVTKCDDNGYWHIDYSSTGFTGYDVSYATGFIGPAYHAVPADYDGDGYADLGLKDDIDGYWRIDYARDYLGRGFWNVTVGGFGGREFFGSSFHAVPADYDGDGKADLAVKDDVYGNWMIDYARDGFGGYNPSVPGFGGADFHGALFHAVPADYDGDGKADLAVKDDYFGGWMVDYAQDGFGGYNPTAQGWGADSGYIAVPGDYDGDGKDDMAIWKTVNGAWHIDFAKDGFNGVTGTGGLIVPNPL
jgi:hypothetical protein